MGLSGFNQSVRVLGMKMNEGNHLFFIFVFKKMKAGHLTAEGVTPGHVMFKKPGEDFFQVIG